VSRRILPLVVLSLVAAACTIKVTNAPPDSVDPGGHLYRIHVEQVRRGRGVADTPDRHVAITATVEETRPNAEVISLVIRKVEADGEPALVAAARKLAGKSAALRLGPNGFEGISLGISGDPDLSVGDIALLFQVISPAIPDGARSPATRSITGLAAPWAERISLDVQQHPAGHRWVRWVLADVIDTDAKGTLVFKLPVAREAPPASSSGRPTSLVDDVFQSLFGYDSGVPAVDALTKSIAAIPFAIAAPFLAFADALGCIFGCSAPGCRYDGASLSFHPGLIRSGSTKSVPSFIRRPALARHSSGHRNGSPSARPAMDQSVSPGRTA